MQNDINAENGKRTMPLVSVVMPCFNCEKYIQEAVMSITNQSYQNLEILLADDCSVDGTFKIIQSMAEHDERIHIIRHCTNKKIVNTLNELVCKAKGKYIARMDADDISRPDRILRQVEYMENHPDCSVCGANVRYIADHGKKFEKTSMPEEYADVKYFLKFFNPVFHPVILARAEVLKNHPYDQEYLYAEDYELWCRLVYKNGFNIANLHEELLLYRTYSGQTSSIHHKLQNKIAADIQKIYTMQNERDADIHHAVFYSGRHGCTADTVKYILRIQKELKSKPVYASIAAEAKLLSYLRRQRKNTLIFRLLMSRLGIMTVMKDRKKKEMRKRELKYDVKS